MNFNPTARIVLFVRPTVGPSRFNPSSSKNWIRPSWPGWKFWIKRSSLKLKLWIIQRPGSILEILAHLKMNTLNPLKGRILRGNTWVWKSNDPTISGPNLPISSWSIFLQSHSHIVYLKRQQKMHPAKRFGILTSRQHGLISTHDLVRFLALLDILKYRLITTPT